VTGEVKTFGPGIGVGAIEAEKFTDELIVQMGELKVAIRLPEDLQSAERLNSTSRTGLLFSSTLDWQTLFLSWPHCRHV